MPSYQEYLVELLGLTEAEWAAFAVHLQPRAFARGTQLHGPGSTCQHVLFVRSGVARSYLLDARGHEATWGIYYNGPLATMKNLFLVDHRGFLLREPGQLYFEALTDLQVWAIDLPGVHAIYGSSPTWQRFGRLVGQAAFRTVRERALSLLAEPATDRYQRLLREMPDLLCQVPLRYIASYLGITPQSLSRLRRGLSR